jgi:hypothetical protein
MLASLLALLSLAAVAAVARLVIAAVDVTIYVNASSTCTTGCGSQASPWKTITAGLANANSQIVGGSATGAIIQVAPGTYNEGFTVFPNCHVICSGGVATINGSTQTQRSTVRFSDGGTPRQATDFSIDGCTITGGAGELRNATTPFPAYSGGGVFVYGDAVVTNNVITANNVSGNQKRYYGGGIYVALGNAVIMGNTITQNRLDPGPGTSQVTSFGVGGGLFVLGPASGVFGHPIIEGNLIAENTVLGDIGKGAGMRVDGNPGSVVRRNLIQGNRAGFGGGAVFQYGTLQIMDNLIYGNSAGTYGGGIATYGAYGLISNNTIFGNSGTATTIPSGYVAATYGGGISITDLNINVGQITVQNNLVGANAVTSTGIGGGLYAFRSSPVVRNNDLWNNIKFPAVSSNVAGDYNDAQVIGQNGNISAAPNFVNAPLFADTTTAAGTTTTVIIREPTRYAVNQKLEYNNDGVVRTITAINASTRALTFTPALGAASAINKMVSNWGAVTNMTENFRLQLPSPAVDTGTNAGVGAFDLQGNPRVSDGDSNGSSLVDMGAYELQRVCTPATEVCNNVDDDCDGSTDEGTLSCGLGACARTVNMCSNGSPNTCTPGTPAAEICNGADDNCDGTVDNDADTDLDGQFNCFDPDDDNDGAADGADCAPLLASVISPPGIVPTITATSAGTSVTFTWPLLAQTHVYDIYRGTAGPPGPGNYLATTSCLLNENPSGSFTDTTVPSVGQVFYYLVAGMNACGSGSVGTMSNGQPRNLPALCSYQGLNADGDLFVNRDDDCPLIANPSQADGDHDGRGDVCDNCVSTPNADQVDTDHDGFGDACDP